MQEKPDEPHEEPYRLTRGRVSGYFAIQAVLNVAVIAVVTMGALVSGVRGSPLVWVIGIALAVLIVIDAGWLFVYAKRTRSSGSNLR